MVAVVAIRREACDSWFSKCVRKRANWSCEYCGKSDGQLDCAHIYGRAQKSVRWDGMNAVALCRYHHQQFTANPIEFTRWLEGHLGEAHMEILAEKRQHLLKTTKALRKEISDHYREQFNQMGDGEEFVSWI